MICGKKFMNLLKFNDSGDGTLPTLERKQPTDLWIILQEFPCERNILQLQWTSIYFCFWLQLWLFVVCISERLHHTFLRTKKNTNNNEKKSKAAHTYAPHFTRKRLLLKKISRFYNNAESKRKQRAFSTNRDISRHLQPLLIQLSSVLLVLLQSK